MTDKRVYQAIDAAPEVLYAKREATDTVAYPVLCDSQGNLKVTVDKTQEILANIENAISAIRAAKSGTSESLVVSILAGTVTTVSTVSTLTNITNIGGQAAVNVVPNIGNMIYELANGQNVSVMA